MQQGDSYRDVEGEQDKKYTCVSGFNKKQIPGEEFLLCFLVLQTFYLGQGKGDFSDKVDSPIRHPMKIPRKHLGISLALPGKFGAGDMNLVITAIQLYLKTK